MTHPPGSSEQAVAALFAERQRYEGWLAALEAKRTSTPPHIFERVHADYAARLQRVIEQFQEHRGVIQGMADALADRLAELEMEDAKQRDARVEAELRAVVGEFTSAECQECVRRTEEARATIGLERSTLMSELSRLRALLEADTTPSRTRAEPSPVFAPAFGTTPTGTRVVAPTAAPPEQPIAVGSAEEAENGRTDGSSSFDELEFLKSVVDSRVEEGPEVPSAPAAPATEVSRPEAPVTSGGAAEPRNTPSSSAPPSATAGIAVGEEVRRGSEHAHGSRAPDTGSSRARTPTFLRETTQEQVKTLRCQECQTMNYPTEWYCERCGAELAAL